MSLFQKNNTMSDQLSDINERLYRLHPNDIQLQTMIQQYSPRSSAEKTVKLCKHCSFAFRTDFNYHESDDYCSKDCRVCHTWFKGTSQSSTNLESVGTSDSQASKSTQYDARQTQRSVNSFVDLSNQNNARRTRDYQAKPQYGSDINDTNSNTWRICNPKGEKIIPLLHRSRKNKEMHIVSPSSISADAVISPVSPSPHTRLLSLFY